MIKASELMDRFGDVEFLHELWMKARAELPRRIEELGPLARREEVACQDDLRKRLHKLRGLISNFLTENRALPLLVQCEQLVEKEQAGQVPKVWTDFERVLSEEVAHLDAWLSERGFPCTV